MDNPDSLEVLAIVPLPSAGEHRRREVNESNQMQWGPHLVKMTIFFDSVFLIPPSNKGRKFCIACGSQATYVKLDGVGEPLAFYCDDHVIEARR